MLSVCANGYFDCGLLCVCMHKFGMHRAICVGSTGADSA
jgi:hypothetical protein